jgi:MYXO-CTERM domain-containing protein
MSRLSILLAVACIAVGGFLASAQPADAGAISPGTWYRFSFGGTDTFVDAADGNASPWTFTAPAIGATFTVTDGFLHGDQFEVYDFDVSQGTTPAVAADSLGTCADPDICVTDALYSSRGYFLGSGNHSITIRMANSPYGSGGAWFRWDEGGSRVPTPAAFGLMALGLVGAALRRRNLG